MFYIKYIMAFQDRINQFRAGLDQQQNHFNDAMGQVATYGQHYLEDKLGQHYENIEKTGAAVLSASLTAGSAYSKAKGLSLAPKESNQQLLPILPTVHTFNS